MTFPKHMFPLLPLYDEIVGSPWHEYILQEYIFIIQVIPYMAWTRTMLQSGVKMDIWPLEPDIAHFDGSNRNMTLKKSKILKLLITQAQV